MSAFAGSTACASTIGVEPNITPVSADSVQLVPPLSVFKKCGAGDLIAADVHPLRVRWRHAHALPEDRRRLHALGRERDAVVLRHEDVVGLAAFCRADPDRTIG